uniref:SRCR domain-containing protein n=1 Tax=Maylandia zebra TaxID=106582 RepID=A0A3P9AW32_9CICH
TTPDNIIYSLYYVLIGQIRLAGSGSTRQCFGRVEIYHSSAWGTVCDDGWDLEDAEVVCRSLDCGTALSATSSALFGQGSGQILLDDVACSGSESSLTECQHRGFGTHNCGHGEDAGVVCSGETWCCSLSPQTLRQCPQQSPSSSPHSERDCCQHTTWPGVSPHFCSRSHPCC